MTSTEKSFCLGENLKIIKNVSLFYLRNTKKVFVTIVKQNLPEKIAGKFSFVTLVKQNVPKK